jgi:hypothetical protein
MYPGFPPSMLANMASAKGLADWGCIDLFIYARAFFE